MSLADVVAFENGVEIIEKSRINFCVSAHDLLVKLVVDESFFDDDDHSVDIYADYDCQNKKLYNHLTFVLHEGQKTKEISYSLKNLPDKDKQKIIKKMNQYCLDVYHQTLEEIAEDDMRIISSE